MVRVALPWDCIRPGVAVLGGRVHVAHVLRASRDTLHLDRGVGEPSGLVMGVVGRGLSRVGLWGVGGGSVARL